MNFAKKIDFINGKLLLGKSMKKGIHIFHFKLNESIRSKLLIHAKTNIKSVSSIITGIIERYMPFIEKNQISFQDKSAVIKLLQIRMKKDIACSPMI